jgi:AP-4 complex subunit epsilon-1
LRLFLILEVIECLSDTDETIQRITLDVLYAMTNPANVTLVTEQLLEHLLNCTDKYFKEVCCAIVIG